MQSFFINWGFLLRIVYFVQDLADAAIARRVRMLRAAGAEVKLIGFRRSQHVIREVEGVETIDLGLTFEARLAQRAIIVILRTLQAWRWRGHLIGADAIVARNLEMCTIALSARALSRASIPLVYECLDIHSALAGRGVMSKLLRWWECYVVSHSSALMISSPAFLDNHFAKLNTRVPQIILAENKQLFLEDTLQIPLPDQIDPQKPWIIGWFGVLRCRQSFEMLLDLAKSEPTLVRIELRGRATGELQKLIDGHLPLPNMQWGGPFDQSELEEMYSGCHFTWAIDYFQSGQNSLWLLPHRLYDGCIYRRPALALEGTQTAVWLLDRSAGVVFSDPVTQLSGFFKTLGSAQYKHLHAAVARVPFDDLAWTLEGCRRLTEEIVDSGKIQPLASPPNPG